MKFVWPKENDLIWYQINVGCNQTIIGLGKGEKRESEGEKHRQRGEELDKWNTNLRERKYQFVSLTKFYLLKYKSPIYIMTKLVLIKVGEYYKIYEIKLLLYFLK